jgi:hypothetical protein
MDWAAPRGRRNGLATKPELVLKFRSSVRRSRSVSDVGAALNNEP